MSKKVWTYIIGILLIICGGLLIIKPERSFSQLVYYLGIAILVTGILKIIESFVNKEKLVFPQDSFINGALNVLFGIILMTNTHTTLKIIPTFIGIWLILKAIFTLGAVVNYKKTKDINYPLLANGIIKLILGIIILTTPIITIVFTGVVLGILLIVVGVFVIINYYRNEGTYKVKVK